MSLGRLARMLAMAVTALASAAEPPCRILMALSLPKTTIKPALALTAGTFAPPAGSQARGGDFGHLPAFCRVAADLNPAANSVIKIAVWMPETGWNGKFMGVGNGGWSGGSCISRRPRDSHAASCRIDKHWP